jgi:hypothetical protein
VASSNCCVSSSSALASPLPLLGPVRFRTPLRSHSSVTSTVDFRAGAVGWSVGAEELRARDGNGVGSGSMGSLVGSATGHGVGVGVPGTAAEVGSALGTGADAEVGSLVGSALGTGAGADEGSLVGSALG